MKVGISVLVSLMALSLTLLGLTSCGHSNDTRAAEAATATQPQPQNKPDLQKQLQDAEQQVRPDIEKQRAQAEQQANQTLDKEAIEAIDQTQKAIDAIAANKNSEALAAIEQATGKINILLARNPATALIPVAAVVAVIDTAPTDDKAITQLGQSVSKAVGDKDFPTARVLLYALMSEIRVRTSNLPLALSSTQRGLTPTTNTPAKRWGVVRGMGKTSARVTGSGQDLPMTPQSSRYSLPSAVRRETRMRRAKTRNQSLLLSQFG